MTKRTKNVVSDPDVPEADPESAPVPGTTAAPDPTALSEKVAIKVGPATSNETEEERNDRLRDTAFAAVPPVVQLDASDDAEVERRIEARLKRPRQEVQAARERAQEPGFVPAESAESIAFRDLKAKVAREVREEVLREKTAAGQPLLPAESDSK